MDPQQILKYRLEAVVGEGPSGTVYRGIDTITGARAAVKILHRSPDSLELIADPAYREMLKNFSHPSAGRIFDFAEVDGRLAIVGEYIDGVSLDRILQEHRSIHPSLSSIGVTVTSVLESIHAAGFVHGNIKPSNIFITPSSEVRLVDAGLGARLIRAEAPLETDPKSPIRYLAPEQILHGEVSVQTDLYQLGAVLYELGYLRPAFSATDRKVLLDAILNETPPFDSFTDLPGDWVLTIEKLLSKLPEERFANATELGVTLEEMAEFDRQPVLLSNRSRRDASPRQYFMLSVLAALLLILWFVVTSYH
jgi:serine/threonine-protein kinase